MENITRVISDKVRDKVEEHTTTKMVISMKVNFYKISVLARGK